MYTKRGGVAAYHIVRIGFCLRSVPSVRVLASAVDDWSTDDWYAATPPRLVYIQLGLNNSDFGKDIITPWWWS